VKLGIPVAHVEAGLRSFDRGMPEEINRLLTDAISDWLFVTEPAGEENLRREGVAAEKIHFVGNVMIDTLRAHLERARQSDVLARLGLEPGGYGVLTLHRPSNVDEEGSLRRLFGVLEEIHAELPIVFPVHPRTRERLVRFGLLAALEATPGIRLTQPLGYRENLSLLADARFVLTDSGGIQEEAPTFGVPVLVLRAVTERPEGVEAGVLRLVGTDARAIVEEASRLLDDPAEHARMAKAVNPFGDGKAAGRIVRALLAYSL
jgi:UDP-N-acetylglucosamine 2-epimerase (non-hydrolysing)